MRRLLVTIPIVLALVFAFACEKAPADDAAKKPGDDPAKVAADSKDKPADGAKTDPAAEGAKKDDAPAEGAEKPAADEKKDEPAAEAVSCDALANKLVDLYKERGKKALFKKEELPTLTAGCKKGKTTETLPSDVGCIMKAGDLAAMRGCAGADKVLKNMMENAP